MDVLISILVALAVVAAIGTLIATWSIHGPQIIGAGFTGYRPDGWPHGVQERDDPWAWRIPEPSLETEPELEEVSAAEIIEIEPVDRRSGRRFGSRSAPR